MGSNDKEEAVLKISSETMLFSKMAGAYAIAEYENNSHAFTGALALRLLVATCRVTEDPMETLLGLYVTAKAELDRKEAEDAD